MSKQEWTKEPWKIFTATSKPDVMVGIGEESSGDAITPALWGTDEEAMANARRIVDCVNACTGIDNPAEYISSLRQENERLRGALKPFADACDPLECKEEGNRDDWDAWEQPEALNVKIGDFKRARQALTKEG